MALVFQLTRVFEERNLDGSKIRENTETQEFDNLEAAQQAAALYTRGQETADLREESGFYEVYTGYYIDAINGTSSEVVFAMGEQ